MASQVPFHWVRREVKGHVVWFDKQDEALFHLCKTWTISKGGYLFGWVPAFGLSVPFHRLVLNVGNTQVDHINRNRLDNRRCNLRAATHSQNMANRARSPRRAKVQSKYRGVVWHKAANSWLAQVSCQNKKYHLGLFKDEEEAARAYDNKAKELHGEFAILNFPEAV